MGADYRRRQRIKSSFAIVQPSRGPLTCRAHTLQLVAPSYFAQDDVSELIFVSDADDDEYLEAGYATLRFRLPTR